MTPAQNRSAPPPGILPGAASLLMIFVVLALTAFATLSYLTARADDRLTQLAAGSIQAYYLADLQGEEIFAQLEAVRPDGPPALAPQAEALGGTWKEEGLIAFSLPVGDRGQLEIWLRYTTPQTPLKRERWVLVPSPLNEQPSPGGLMTSLPIF